MRTDPSDLHTDLSTCVHVRIKCSLGETLLSRPRGTLSPLTRITEFLQNGFVSASSLSFLVNFHSENSVPTISPYVCCHGNQTTLSIILNTRISAVIQVFPSERNFLWDNLWYFGYHNTLRSSIKAHLWSVTVVIFQKLFCPNTVIDTKLTDQVTCLSSAFYATGIL